MYDNPFTDEMMDDEFFSQMPSYERGTANETLAGLHLKVGQVYAIDQENMTVTIGNSLTEKTPKAMLDNILEEEAMILCPSVGMQMRDVGDDKFCIDAQLPPIGSHVIYAHINGVRGSGQTVVLGSVIPMRYAYNTDKILTKMLSTFKALNLRKMYDSPSGYFKYEDEDGYIILGYADHTDTKVPIIRWIEQRFNTGQRIKTVYNSTGLFKAYEEEIAENGNFTRIIYDAAGVIKHTYTAFSDGSVSLTTNPSGAGIEIDATGKITIDSKVARVAFKNTAQSLKDILSDMQALLENNLVVTNWLGNMGAPLVYTPIAVDGPKVVALAAKIDALLE